MLFETHLLGGSDRDIVGANIGSKTFSGVVRMKSVRWFIAGAVLGLLSSAAFAFQEQNGASPAPGSAVKAPAVELSPAGVAPTTAAGPEVRIPGFGRLGLLPKLDLGLELLYGATETDRKPTDVDRASPTGTDDENLRIRGTLKHRF